MPIRFRCAYCNQLMGIASRKAGTVVKCPKCTGEIIVPVPEGAESPEDAAEEPGTEGAPEDPNPTATVSAEAPTETANEPSSPQPVLPTAARRGIFLSLPTLF